jgi:HisA/HisF family protein
MLQSPIEIIPVVDLKGGKAVGAVGALGRAAYAPLSTPHCPTGDPVDAARGFLAIHPFKKLYIADLDAIEGGEARDSTLERIRHEFPNLELWVDNGLNEEAACRAWMAKGLGRLALGSESQRAPGLAPRLGAVLSLDFRKGMFLGPRAILDEPRSWPHEVIGMTLDEIGAAKGPDLRLLEWMRRMAPEAAVYAAGGVRNASDMKILANLGVRGALVATALLNGSLSSRDIRGLIE